MDQYCQEYNRTMPQQTEGPEYTPYINKGTVPEKASPSALLAALLAAAAIAALLFPLCFAIRNIGSRSAQLHYEISAEEGYEGTDIVTFQLYCGGKVIEEGQIPIADGFLDLDGLTPDTRYSISIYKNDELVKTLWFRTKPEDNPPPAEPEPEPEPPAEPSVPETQEESIPETSEETVPETSEETVPETSEETTPETEPPYIPPYTPPDGSNTPPATPPSTKTSLTFNSISSDYGRYINDTYIVYLDFDVTVNDSQDISYQVFLNGILEYEGTENRCELYGIPTGNHIFEVIVHFTTDGITDSISKTYPMVLGVTHNAPGVSDVTMTRSGNDLIVSGTISFGDAEPDSVSMELDAGMQFFDIPYIAADEISGTFNTTIFDFPFSDPYPTYVTITIQYSYFNTSLLVMTDYILE